MTTQLPTATVPIGEHVGIVAAKYGIAAIIGPVLLMLVVNFMRHQMCQCLRYHSTNSGGISSTTSSVIEMQALTKSLGKKARKNDVTSSVENRKKVTKRSIANL